MLVENKFIYISLPRCASTSFMASCVEQKLQIKHFDDRFDIESQIKKYRIDLNKIQYNNFDITFEHGHEPVSLLKEKYGDNYDVISVRRNKYERFVSLWNHLLKMLYINNHTHSFKKCLYFNVDDILFYNTNDIQSNVSVKENVEIFIEKHKLFDISEKYKELFYVLLNPCARWHQHNSDIIWFDFEELYKLEDWVSNKLNIDFKLNHINSSKNFESNLILNDEFKEKYDSIYLPYDEIKSVKTLF
jgi:hypothetical protein